MSTNDPILDKIQADRLALRTKNGVTPLMLACLEVDEAEFERRLAASDLHAVDKDGRTALHEVARNAHRNEEAALRMIQRLVEAGANVNVQDKRDKYSPLMEAAIYGYLKIVQFLLDSGADPNLKAKGKRTAIGLIEDAPSLKRSRKQIVAALEAAGGTR